MVDNGKMLTYLLDGRCGTECQLQHITTVIFLNRVHCTVAVVERAEDEVFQSPHWVTDVQSADCLLVLAGLSQQ